MENLTEKITETIDHIAISKKFIGDSKAEIVEWNIGKELSDHKGISVKLK
jgi:endonuclease/exonuclease/phosphatase family metal-dependent hydrolase